MTSPSLLSLFALLPHSHFAFRDGTLNAWWRILSWQDYNTRIVVLGTVVLGMAAGLIGSFALLRKRALMGDALAHATLPGICSAFMLGAAFGGSGKNLLFLLLGAAASGILGILAILYIKAVTRLKEDAAMGIVLSVFFGGGVSMLGLIQQMGTGHAAGLETFIYGQTASMVAEDAWLIAITACFSLLSTSLLFKELKLLCFDASYAQSRGFPTLLLDILLMTQVVLVTIVGLQAVGLVLMIALLVIPPATARFWTDDLRRLAIVSSLLGGLSCWLGASMSGVFHGLPSGALIVLSASAIFILSLLFGSQRGLLMRTWRRWHFQTLIDANHVLRGMYELAESLQPLGRDLSPSLSIPLPDLLALRSWSPSRLQRIVRRLAHDGLLYHSATNTLRFTEAGWLQAKKFVRDHRLWEIYLITHADVAPGRVDQGADAIEHVLDPAMISALERLLSQQPSLAGDVPPDPHRPPPTSPTSAEESPPS